jgi:tetratricopeptide (TPR) repeat protein
VLALVGVRIAESVGAGRGAAHLVGHEGEGIAGLARALFAPLHLLDVANLVLFLVPLAPLLLLVPAWRRRTAGATRPAAAGLSRREWGFLLLLAAPFLLTLPLIHPAQGVPRDFDVFAAAGVALALLLAAAVAPRLRSAPGAGWLAPALLVAALAPPLEYLLLQADLERGLARVEALAAGPPLRPEYERAKLREFLGARYYRSGHLREAVAQYAQAAALGPSPNIVLGWAAVSEYAGDLESEERAYRLLLERAGADQDDVRALVFEHLADIRLRRGDRQGARSYAEQALRLAPASALARRTLERLARQGGGP